MPHQELLNYISQQIEHGTSREQIKKSLLDNGWREQDIEEGLGSSAISSSVSPISSPATAQISRSARKFGILAITVSVIIGTSLIGGGAFAYFKYFQLTPEETAKKLITNLVNIKSIEYSGEMRIEIENTEDTAFLNLSKDSSSKTSNYLISFSNSSDFEDLNNLKNSISFSTKSGFESDSATMFGMDIINKNNIIFLKINDLPTSELFGFIDTKFLEPIKNKWLKASTNEIEEEFDIFSESESPSTSPENIEKIKTIIKQAPLFKKVEKIDNEYINGIKMSHYKLALNKSEILKLVSEIDGIRSDKTRAEIQDDFQEILESYKMTELNDVEIWVNKKDYLPYKVLFGFSSEGFEGTLFTTKFNADLRFKSFNQPITINTPEQSTPLQDVIKGMLEEIFLQEEPEPIDVGEPSEASSDLWAE